MKKAKPRDNIFLPLMKSTFTVRRDRVVDSDEQSFASILAKYPALSVVSLSHTYLTQLHFVSIVTIHIDGTRIGFDNWKKN